MRISTKFSQYLLGKSYSNGLAFEPEFDSEDFCLRGRVELLREICTNKKVVHLGCVDHDHESIRRKLHKGKWLHAEISKVADRCLGIDIAESGIRFMREELGYEDVAALDALHESGPIASEDQWDFFLIPEVIEHVDNPVAFLSGLRERQASRVGRFIVTTPNAFQASAFKLARQGMESINSDHRYWFTPYTLSKVATQAGFEVEKLLTCLSGIVKKRHFIRNFLSSRQPLTRGNLVAWLR